jgi:hypothetical protein
MENRNRKLFPYTNAAAAAATLTRKPKIQKQSCSILSSADKTTFRDPSQFPLNTQFQKPAEKAQILQLHRTNLFRFSNKIYARKINNRSRHAPCDATAEIVQLPVVSFRRRRSVRFSSIIFRSKFHQMVPEDHSVLFLIQHIPSQFFHLVFRRPIPSVSHPSDSVHNAAIWFPKIHSVRFASISFRPLFYLLVSVR